MEVSAGPKVLVLFRAASSVRGGIQPYRASPLCPYPLESTSSDAKCKFNTLLSDIDLYKSLTLCVAYVTVYSQNSSTQKIIRLHLLGNSFSIPVVEYLMTRLCEVFASREYEGYNYQYRWENNNGD